MTFHRKVLIVVLLLFCLQKSVHCVNEQILKRVDDHISNFMDGPVRVIRRAQRFLRVGGFPSLQAPDRDFVAKWLWMELFNTVYYGLEDGTFLYYDHRRNGAERPGISFREPGFGGYSTDPVPEESLKYWTACLDNQGQSTNCTMPEGSSYVKCIGDCESLMKCNTPKNQCEQFELLEDRKTCENDVKWCRQYSIETIANGETLGGVAHVLSCMNEFGAPDQTLGNIILGDFEEQLELGNCYYMDGSTLVNRTLEDHFAYCGEGECYRNVGAFDTDFYDPRYRPWYIGSKETQWPIWSDPYVFSRDLHIGITYTEPIYAMEGPKKVFKGVFAVDITLVEFGEFLLQFQSSDFLVAVVEADEPNYVIATSTGSTVFTSVRRSDMITPCGGAESGADCALVRVPILELDEHPKDTVLRRAFAAQSEAGFPDSEIVPFKKSDSLRADAYFSQGNVFEQANANMKWHVLVVTPMTQSSSDAAYAGTPPFYIILTAAIVGFTFCFSLFLTLFRLRKHRTIQNADWRFTCAFLVGSALLNLSSLSLLGENSDWSCMLRMWLFNLCFAAAMSPLFVKVWRMHKLLHASTQFRRVNVTNFQALIYTLPIIVAEIVILTVFSFVDPVRAVENLGSAPVDFGQTQSVTCQQETQAFFATQAAFHTLLVLLGCYLAYETRNLDARFGEAKQLAFAMYNTAFTAIVLALISGLVEMDAAIQWLLIAIGVAWGSMFNSAAFVVPRLAELRQERAQLMRTKSIHSNKKFVLQGRHEVLVSTDSDTLDDSPAKPESFTGKTSSTPETEDNLPNSKGAGDAGNDCGMGPEHRGEIEELSPRRTRSNVTFTDA